MFEGDRCFDIVVRLPNIQRNDMEALGAIPVALPSEPGQPRGSVTLRQLANFQVTDGLNEISRNGKRRIYVEANVGGRDLGSFVPRSKSGSTPRFAYPPGRSLAELPDDR